MQYQPFIASTFISIALALFLRFGAETYSRLFVLKFDTVQAIWIVGTAAFAIVKAIQLAPIAHRLGALRGIGYRWLVFAAIAITPIDALVIFPSLPWIVNGAIAPDGVLMSIGAFGWAGLVRLLVLQWVDLDELRTLPARTPHIVRPNSVQYTPEAPAIPARTQFRSNTDRQFVSQLIPKVASLFVAGLSGSGKDFVGSILCEYLQSEFGARIFFVDPKNDPDEQLWNNADYQYRFSGTLMEPDEFLGNLKKAFKQYGERLSENGSGQYTILVLNELATCATKVDNSSDKKWLAATLQPMLSGLDSAGGAVMVLTQTLIMPTGFNSGTVSQFQKLIICREEHLENLSTQSKTVLMTGVDLTTASGACEDSPVDRAIYSSALRKWLPLPKMRQGQGQSYYDRDARCWVGTPPSVSHASVASDSGGGGARNKNSENGGNLDVLTHSNAPHRAAEYSQSPVAATTAATAQTAIEIDDLILDYFAAVKVPQPKSLRDIKYSSRIRSAESSDLAIQSALDRLVISGTLVERDGSWSFPDWDNN